MSLASRAGDLFYTFKFIRMLATPFNETDAFKLGIIDDKGKRIKTQPLDTPERKTAYTTFHRLVFNMKKIAEKIPFGKSKLASYAAALFLIKEEYGLSDKNLEKIIRESGFETLDFLAETNTWFLLEDKRLTPGVYRLSEDKQTIDVADMMFAKDRIRIGNDCYPVGEVFGLDIYEGQHINTRQKVYFTIGEITK